MRRVIALALLAACGDDGAARVDAGGDARPDADSASVVRLTVTVRGAPRAGARVVFQDPVSVVIADSLTGEDGSAAAEVPAGGFVTLVEPELTPVGPNPPPTINDRLDTFAGVELGDDLHIDLDPKPAITMVTVTVPSDPGAASFKLSSTCGSGSIAGGLPTQVPFADCHGTADVAVVGYTDIGDPVQGMYRAAQPIDDHGILALTGAWDPLAHVSITSDPAPAWAAQIGLELSLRSAHGSVFAATQVTDVAAPAVTIAAPVAAGTTYAVRATLFPQATALIKQDVLAWGLAPGDIALVLAADLLGPFTSAPVLDLPARTVTWTEDPGAAADVVRAQIHVFRDGQPAHAWDWQIVGPRGATPSITYPALPAAAGFDFVPTPRDSFAVRGLETLRVPGGYDAVRPHALHTRLDQVTGAASGRATYQTLYQLQD